MIQTLILSHGSLAQSLLETARNITGGLPDLHALALDWNAPREAILGRLREVVAGLDEGQGVLILTDLYGDTPSNLALGLVEAGRVEVVTGVNLPMVLRLSCLGTRPADLAGLATWIQDKGKQGIRRGACVVEVLAGSGP
jgi:PTS system mannose-specific IIA component